MWPFGRVLEVNAVMHGAWVIGIGYAPEAAQWNFGSPSPSVQAPICDDGLLREAHGPTFVYPGE